MTRYKVIVNESYFASDLAALRFAKEMRQRMEGSLMEAGHSGPVCEVHHHQRGGATVKWRGLERVGDAFDGRVVDEQKMEDAKKLPTILPDWLARGPHRESARASEHRHYLERRYPKWMVKGLVRHVA